MTAKDMILDQKSKAQAVVDGFDAIATQMDVDLKAQYDQGVSDGKASISNPGDKIFDQAEVDALMKPLQDSLVAKESQITQLQSDFDAFKSGSDAQVSAKVLAAVQSIKDNLTVEQTAEKTFADSLDQVIAANTPAPATS